MINAVTWFDLQVSKAYSKTWSFREDALLDVMRQMSELPSGSRDEARNMMRAAIFLVNKGIKDKVFAVSQMFILFLWDLFTAH